MTTTAPRARPGDAPAVVEGPKHVAEAGAARPVGDLGGRGGHGEVGIAAPTAAGEAGQAGAERERLDAAAGETAAWAKRTSARA